MNKLFRLKIDGVSFDDNTAYESLFGNPYIMASTNPSSANYEDITSIENLENIGFTKTGKDYIFVRDAMFDYVASVGWDSLTAERKQIAGKYKIGTDAQRLADIGVANMTQYGIEYNKKSTECRQARWDVLISNIHNCLAGITLSGYKATSVALGVMNAVVPNAVDMLINLGFGGIVDLDEGVGALDYINATAGTPFAVTGLPFVLGVSTEGLRGMTEWIPNGFANISDFCDHLLNIFQNGEY